MGLGDSDKRFRQNVLANVIAEIATGLSLKAVGAASLSLASSF
jgi:hypothetical protein